MKNEFVRDHRKTGSATRELTGLVSELSHGRVTRRQFVERALALGLTASTVGGFLVACGKKSDGGGGGSPEPVDTTTPSQIYLYNWSDYMSGAVKNGFQKKTGIKVVETFFDDNEALLAKLKAGATGYDVIVPSDYMVHIMMMSDLLEPLDMSYIPNFKYITPKFQNPAYDDAAKQDGKKYSVPYQWGTTGIGYRRDKVSAEPTKWSDLWNTAYKGDIDMLNDERETPGAALKMLGFSLNTTDQAQLDQAVDKLIEQKPLVRQYDSINMKRNLIAGVPLVHSWNGDALLAMDGAGPGKVGWSLPEEGYTIWIDNLAIPQGFKSKYGALLFMDYILDPKVMAELTDWIWYLPPEPDAEKHMTTKLVLDTIPTEEVLQRGEIINDVGAFARNYSDAWARVKSS